MNVREVMTDHVEWVDPNQTLETVAKTMRKLDIGCLPVGENDRLVGMITDRDITCRGIADGCDPTSTKTSEVMSKGILTCFDDEDIDDAAKLMEEKQVHRLAVLNRDKRMVGLLSVGDISLHCTHELSGEVLEAISKHTH